MAPRHTESPAPNRRQTHRTSLQPAPGAIVTWLGSGLSEEVEVLDLSEGGCAMLRCGTVGWRRKPEGPGRLDFKAGAGPGWSVRLEVRTFAPWKLGVEFVDAADAPLAAAQAAVRALAPHR